MMIERSTPMYKETLSLIMTLSEYSLFYYYCSCGWLASMMIKFIYEDLNLSQQEASPSFSK